MLGVVVGLSVTGISGYGVIKSMDSMKKLANEKNKLIKNIKPFSQLVDSDNNKLQLVSIDNKTRAGLLEIFQKREEVEIRHVIDSYGLKQVELAKKSFWDSYISEGVKLNLGQVYLIPPKKLNKIIIDKENTVQVGAENPGALMDHLHQNYGVNFKLPHRGLFSSQFTSFENKIVYAYGSRLPNKNFNAEIMGTNSTTVANKVFENEENDNDGLFALSVLGFVGGLAVAVVSGSSN